MRPKGHWKIGDVAFLFDGPPDAEKTRMQPSKVAIPVREAETKLFPDFLFV